MHHHTCLPQQDVPPDPHTHPAAEDAKSHSTLPPLSAPPTPLALALRRFPRTRSRICLWIPFRPASHPGNSPLHRSIHRQKRIRDHLQPLHRLPARTPPDQIPQSNPPSSAATRQSCSSRSAQTSAPDAVPPQNFSALSLPPSDNPETPHPQSTPARALGKAPPASPAPLLP